MIIKRSVFIEQHSSVNNFSINKSWSILSGIEERIKNKIEEAGVPLKDWDIQINYGIKTGLNEAFIISGEKKDELIAEDPKSAEIIRPILRGRDIKRYSYDFADLWLINTHNGIPQKSISRVDINQYIAIKNHLNQYYHELVKRFDKGDTPYNLRSCDYMDDFNKQKIVYNDINSRLSFAVVEPGIFLNNTVYFIPENPHLKYLLAVLNSKLINWYYKTLSVQLGEKAVRMFSIYVNKIPIPMLNKKEEDNINYLIDRLGLNNKEIRNIDREIDMGIYNLYNLTSTEIEFIDNGGI